MTESDIVKKIRELRKIQPRKDWVSLTKTQILGEEPRFSFFPYFKPAFAGLIAVLVILGVFGFAKNSLPGDSLYVVRKVIEKSRAVFVSEKDLPAFQLQLANDRLEELSRAPVKNLAPTINEFQQNLSSAAKNLAKMQATTSTPAVIKKIVEETKKLEENKQKIESLGVVIDKKSSAELDTALKSVVENLIGDLEKRTLTEEQTEVLDEIKQLFQEGKYSDALELYLTNQQ